MKLVEKLRAHFRGHLTGKRIAVWGLASHADRHELGDSRALRVVDWLLAEGAHVVVHDPSVIDQVRERYGDCLEYESQKWHAARNADALVMMTPCTEYVGVDAGMLRWHLGEPTIFDDCQCLCRRRIYFGDLQYYATAEEGQPTCEDAETPQIFAIDDYRQPACLLQTTGT